jgi:hypothetical protein
MQGAKGNSTARKAMGDTNSLPDYFKYSGNSMHLSQSYELRKCKIK